MTFGQWAARGADSGTASTRETPNHEKPNELGNDALPGGESEGGSAAQTDGPPHGEVPTTEHLDIKKAAAIGTQLPEVEKQEGDGGDSEAASRLSRTTEDGRYQKEVITIDYAQGVQQSTPNDYERHEPHVELLAPPAEKGLYAADSEVRLKIKSPNDPRYLEALVAEHVEGPETLLPHNNHGPREKIDVAAAVTEKDLDPGSEDGTIDLMTGGDAEGVEAAKSLGIVATQQEQDADYVESFEIETQLVQEASQPHETLAHPASVVAAGTI